MKQSAWLTLFVAALLGACAPLRPDSPRNTPTMEAAARPGVAAAMDGTRDIVLAVANPQDAPSTHAGSTMLGYVPAANYDAGQRALSELETLRKQYGWREVTGWPIKSLKLYCIVLEPPAGMTRDALLAMLSKDVRIALAQPLQDYAVYSGKPARPHQYNDPYANLQRGFVETDAALAHGISRGDRVHIAIVDTGVDLTHPDLQGRIHDSVNEVDDNAQRFNHDPHGTEVAGIIGATGDNHIGIVGMAPGAIISVYKACWYPAEVQQGARCNSFTLAKAMAAILDTDARIINLSLGGPSDPLLDKLLQQLLAQQRIVIAALPPDGNRSGFPDDAAGVLVVRTGNTTPAPPGVLSAPGRDILTTQPGGGYDFASGSSMAAAHVSGIVALLLSLSPELDADSLRQLLLGNGKAVGGAQQVDAAAALNALGREQLALHH
ncbi:S8 family serine peptidase [Dyella telluris]|uniref:S8 family serine peptidase n=1 Tax=Dyella telluris TaxID=2763498 RepID=A0A7G8PZZ8_9GAMM|nr:S8 family serine peptidase [Dyella telluris]QNK00106.1 S8 family serine peptidase [Dyella telluris]